MENQNNSRKECIDQVEFLIEAYIRQKVMSKCDGRHEVQLNGIISNYFNIGLCSQIMDDGKTKWKCENVACDYCVLNEHPKCNDHAGFGIEEVPVFCNLCDVLD